MRAAIFWHPGPDVDSRGWWGRQPAGWYWHIAEPLYRHVYGPYGLEIEAKAAVRRAGCIVEE